MIFHNHDKLIAGREEPHGFFYRAIIGYSSVMVLLIMLFSLSNQGEFKGTLYFIINLFTVIMFTLFIRKSFNLLSTKKYVFFLRVGLFFLLNSTLASMAGGVNLLKTDMSCFLSASFYVLGILLITQAFHKFVIYVNESYKSAVDLSLTDELTGLPNRRHLNLQLIGLEKAAGAIGIIDVDHFKKINDTYGHEMGDKVLRDIGLILHRFISDDIFIARSGGEEFSIIITNHSNADDIIREIKQRIAKENTRDVSVTVSIGVANKQAHHSPAVALTAADEALYKAKRAGRDQIVYASYSLQRPVSGIYQKFE